MGRLICGGSRWEGSTPFFTAEFRDRATGALVAASAVTLQVRDALGAVMTYSGGQISNPSTGKYERAIAMPDRGYYRWAWKGDLTGGETVRDEGAFHARRSFFG